MGPSYGEDEEIPRKWRQRVLDSFKPDPRFVRENGLLAGEEVGSGRVWDPHAAAENTANSPLARRLKGRHLQMIAIGGSIGMLII
jgi:amino acid transporter